MFYGADNLIFQKAMELRNRSTPAEELLWNYLRKDQLGSKFRRQHPCGIYVLDFYCHELQLAIELDGSIHQLEAVKKNDVIRENTIKRLGITILRFDNREVFHNVETILNQIKQVINSSKSLHFNVSSTPLGAGGHDSSTPLGAGGA